MALDVAGHRHLERGSTNLLAIGFSALDKVGHDFGPNSHEIQDVLIRLDRTLGTLFAGLDRLVGAGNYTVALTADHGVAPIPERALSGGLQAGRVSAPRVVAAIEDSLGHAFGPAKYVAAVLHSDVYLEPGVYGKLLAAPAVFSSLRSALLNVPGVAGLITAHELGDATQTAVARAFANSYSPGRSGDLVIVYRPYWIDDETGTGHGTPYAYDTHVPVLLVGKGIAGGEYLGAASPLDLAPTLAFLAGIALPHADGRLLTEALSMAQAPLGRAATRP